MNVLCNRMRNGRSRSSKVVDFVLLIINSNLGPILHRFWDMGLIGRKMPIFLFHSNSTPSFGMNTVEHQSLNCCCICTIIIIGGSGYHLSCQILWDFMSVPDVLCCWLWFSSGCDVDDSFITTQTLIGWKLRIFPTPLSFNTRARGKLFRISGWTNSLSPRLESDLVTVACVVLTQCQRATDGQTDGCTDRS